MSKKSVVNQAISLIPSDFSFMNKRRYLSYEEAIRLLSSSCEMLHVLKAAKIEKSFFQGKVHYLISCYWSLLRPLKILGNQRFSDAFNGSKIGLVHIYNTLQQSLVIVHYKVLQNLVLLLLFLISLKMKHLTM